MSLNQICTQQLDLRSYKTTMDGHSHFHAQLVLPIEGELELCIGNHVGIVDSSKAAFIPGGESHCFSGSSKNLFLVVDIEPDNRVLNTVKIPNFFNLTIASKKFIDFSYSYLNSTEHFFSNDLIHNLLLNLLAEPFISEQDHCVELAKNWMDLHFSSPINISLVAKECNLSLSQLQRRFKRVTGVTLAEYWRDQRLKQAQWLLVSGRGSVESIAFAVGYENLSAFSRRFSNSFGISPSGWREMNLSAQKMTLWDNNS